MKAYSFIIIICTCCVCKYTSFEVRLELKKNISNFGYRINFRYEGMFAHYFDTFYAVTEFILPTVNDLKFLPIDFDEKCNYLNADLSNNQYWKEYVKLKIFLRK